MRAKYDNAHKDLTHSKPPIKGSNYHHPPKSLSLKSRPNMYEKHFLYLTVGPSLFLASPHSADLEGITFPLTKNKTEQNKRTKNETPTLGSNVHYHSLKLLQLLPNWFPAS